MPIYTITSASPSFFGVPFSEKNQTKRKKKKSSLGKEKEKTLLSLVMRTGMQAVITYMMSKISGPTPRRAAPVATSTESDAIIIALHCIALHRS
jgi:hypothetical protein